MSPIVAGMDHVEQTRDRFAALVSPGAGRLDGHLDEGALLIASALDPEVVIAEQMQRLDGLAARFSDPEAADLALGLFGGAAQDPSRHFCGNRTDYYEMENSMLHRVLDRRIGIPISLAVLLIEVGRRCGVSMHGVGMPGHFLVGSAHGYIDPFHGGVLLDAAGCGRLFQRLSGGRAALPADALDPTPPASILKRMLANVAAIATDGRHRRALWAVRGLLASFPEATHRDHVQHAYAAADAARFDIAAAAAETALETVPPQVRAKLRSQIDVWRAQLN